MLRSQIRIERTRREFESTTKEIDEWHALWEQSDLAGQFATPRRMLGEVLDLTFAGLREGFAAIGATGLKPDGAIYSRCAAFDRKLLWTRRLWQYYASKVDQRRQDKLSRVLAVADEVVWSCYTTPFQNACSGAARRGPSPLPYFEPQYSAQATPRVDIPPDLRDDRDAGFSEKCLAQLPISLIALPVHCIAEPWWLILLGHEVGHHVQFDVQPPRELFTSFGQQLSVYAAERDKAQGTRWLRWHPEVFADAFSVHALGAWAAWAMVDIETRDDNAMIRETNLNRSAYPAPWVRMHLLAALVAQLDPAENIVRSSLPDADFVARLCSNADWNDYRKQAEADIATVPTVSAGLVARPLKTLGTFKELCDWQPHYFASGGLLKYWAGALQGEREALQAERSLRMPRLLVAAAVAAWHEISERAGENGADEKERDNLIENFLFFVPKCAEEGTRAADQSSTPESRLLADELIRLLMQEVPGEK